MSDREPFDGGFRGVSGTRMSASASTAPSSDWMSSAPSTHAATSLASLTEYANRELSRLGFPVPLVFHRPSENDATEIAQAIITLVQQRQSDFARFTETEHRLRRTTSDYGNLEFSLQREREKSETLERQNREILAKLSKTESTLKEAVERNKNTAEEIKALKSNTVQAKKQFMHEKRKWEGEQSNLRQKLLKISSDRLKEGAVLFKVLNPSPLVPKRNNDLEEFYQQILRCTEERDREQVNENRALKLTIYDMWVEVQHMHSSVADFVPVTELPFEMVRETVEQRLRAALQDLREAWQADQNAHLLEQELQEKQALIEEQEQLLWHQHARLDELTGQIEDFSHQMSLDEGDSGGKPKKLSINQSQGVRQNLDFAQ